MFAVPMRRAVAVALALAAVACGDDFLADPQSGRSATITPDGWPAGLIIGDEITLRVAVTDVATGARVAPESVQWSASPSGALEAVGGGSDVAIFRVAALGDIGITARLRDAAFDTASFSATLPSRLAGVSVEVVASDTLRSIGAPAFVRARGLDANGAEVQTGGWSWTVHGDALTATGSLALDSLRVVSSATGVGWVVASHAQCVGECRDSVAIVVRQAAASIAFAVDSVRLESIGATSDVAVIVRDSLGQPIAGVTNIVWESAAPGVATVSANAAAGTGTITAQGNGSALIRVRLDGLVDSLTARVAQRAIDLVQIAGTGQSAVVATSLPDSLTVEARDAGGFPVAGAPIGWRIVAGSGSIAGSAVTGADGRASAAWTLGTTPGTQAAAGFLAGIDTVAFEATALVGPAAKITAAPDTVELSSIGATAQLTAAVTDAYDNPSTVTVTWTALAPSIASVSATGTVTAVANGTARIEARAGGAADTVIVRVVQTAASVTMSVDSVRLSAIGAATEVTATVRDAGGTPIANPTGVTWESTVGTVVTAQPNATDSTRATLTATGNGTAFVRVRVGGTSDEATVVVQQTVASAVIAGGDGQSGIVGTTLPDSLRVEARDALGSPVAGVPVVWTVLSGGGSVSGTSVTATSGRARVAWTLGATAGTQQVRAIVAGVDTVVFTATAQAGTAAQLDATPASATLNFIGDTEQLSATLRDGLGNVVPGTATWSSTNDGVAAVSLTGLVTAHAPGSALVIAQAGVLSDTVEITVTQVVATISLDVTSDTLSRGDTLRIIATPRDSGGTTVPGATVTWSSTNTAVATVDASGKVTAQGLGPASIRATVGGVQASASITVASWALSFDGGDMVEVASGSAALDLDSVPAFTIETWVRPRSTSGGAVVARWSGSKPGSSYAIYLRGLVPRVYLRNSTGASIDSLSAVTPLAQNVWQHIALVYDHGVATLYVNGVVADTRSGVTAPNAVTAAPLRFGADGLTTPTFLFGDLDEIRIWSVARTAAEILGSMNVRVSGSAGLRAYWPLREGAGDPIDLVGGLTGVRGGALGAAAVPTWILDGSPAP